MMDKVSIIIPVYNAEKYIRKTVESVQAQTYKNWEIWLIEDSSEDESKRVLEELAAQDPERIHAFSKENEGAAKARNFGLAKATGRYIAYLDADDLWSPQKLEKQLAYIKKTGAAFCFTGYEFADEEGVGTGKVVRVPETLSYKQALKNTTIFTSTVIFDTTLIDKENLEMPDIKSEDSALWFKVLRMGYVAHGLDENLVRYRRVGGSLSSNKLEALRRIWNLYRKSEHLSVPYSMYNFFFWAVRAVKRRI